MSKVCFVHKTSKIQSEYIDKSNYSTHLSTDIKSSLRSKGRELKYTQFSALIYGHDWSYQRIL